MNFLGLVRLLAASAVALVPFTSTASTTNILSLASPINGLQFNDGFTTFMLSQGIVADDAVLDSASVLLRSLEGTFNFSLLVTTARTDNAYVNGLGLAPNLANVVFDSGMLSLPLGSPVTEVEIQPHFAVEVGQTYFLVIDGFSYPASRGTVWRAEAQATRGGVPVDPYEPGEFVHVGATRSTISTLADFNDLSWIHRDGSNQDLAFSVTFVPEPSTASLLALGLVGLGLGLGRRYQ